MTTVNNTIVLSEVEIDEVAGGPGLWDDIKEAWHNLWCCSPYC